MSRDYGPDVVIAHLRLPAPVEGLHKLARALERTYGAGLVIDTDPDPAIVPEGTWLTIKTPLCQDPAG